MPLIQTCSTEFSDLFRPFFENCPPEIERTQAIPVERPTNPTTMSSFPQVLQQQPAPMAQGFSQPGQGSSQPLQNLLLNLDPVLHPDPCGKIAKEFYSHAHDKTDYQIKSVHLLRNPVIWMRYQAEKQLRRQIAAQQAQAHAQTRMSMAMSTSTSTSTGTGTGTGTGLRATTAATVGKGVNDVDPQWLFRDEVLFHGTRQDRVGSILLNGLDPRMTVRANYGKGVYFSDSIEKCMQYVDPQTSFDQEFSIVLCCVLLGRLMVEPHEREERKLGHYTMFVPEGFESAVAYDAYKEWIVFEKSQILPLCVINFTATNRADSFYRLGAHYVLSRGIAHQTANIHDTPPLITVTVPKDPAECQQEQGAMEKLRTWHDPDGPLSSLLYNVLGITPNSAKVCEIQFTESMECAVWFRQTLTQGQFQFLAQAQAQAQTLTSTTTDCYCYVKDTNLAMLLLAAKNVEVLEQRLRDAQQRTLQTMRVDRNLIEARLSGVRDANRLLETMAILEPELQRINAEGVTYHQELLQLRQLEASLQQASWQERNERQQRIRLYDQRLKELVTRNSELTKPLYETWTQGQIDSAYAALEMKKGMERKVQGDLQSQTRQQEAIDAEKSRLRNQANGLFVRATKQELDLRLLLAKRARDANERAASANNTGNRQQQQQQGFQTKEVKVRTETARVWPQIVAEFLLPQAMFNQLGRTNKTLNFTNCSKPWGHIPDEGEAWWEYAAKKLFQAEVASAEFWPLCPRQRLPNRRMFYMTDYVEWLFLEKENRIRKRDWRLNRLSGQTQGQAQGQGRTDMVPPQNLLQDMDLGAFFREQWGQLDPSIPSSIQDLSSRSGTVVFKREERQKELDQRSTGLLSLFVAADPDMLSSLSSGTSEAPNCPICKEALELPEPGSTAASETVVKLKSCRHCFHLEGCIQPWFEFENSQLRCPMCSVMCTTETWDGLTKSTMQRNQLLKLGPMPDSTMGYFFDVRLGCYFIYVMTPSHKIPNPDPQAPPGSKVEVRADTRYAVVPFSARMGPLLMIRLICLFYYGHLFAVGRSVTRGVDNVVVWNGVHLRTAMTGAYGFPAPHFEKTCWEEINKKGIAKGLEELLLGMPLPDGTDVPVPEGGVLGGEVLLPAEVVEELAEDERLRRIFHKDQPLLFRV
ncbi:hypothetical protein BC939DRAFT_495935 [Gamsiella multidivaricata]|uniref:uncharacterized protein n=1 Tax=Gamsiella multidivaricata TaxID=101098 RepID=UPI002220FCE4|nr:uncharacterized protein BC939DRAFT_495935 [Gamsiella multidivaricata]KAI7818476.1 hypothetical protein BC939DRAFT_495935 [Gamsiella multidivaricata]